MMKKKLLKHIVFLFILLTFGGCVNEMDMIDHEQNFDPDIELFVLPDPIKAIFEFDKSINNIYDRSNILSHIEFLYSNRKTRKLLIFLMESGIRINFYKFPAGSESKNEAQCKPSFIITEIGFNGSNHITFENLLHELLHLYAYLNYKTYTDGYYAACEEYEVRVLTDLIMSRDFKGLVFEYQGMKSVSGDSIYSDYQEWLKTLINAYNYNSNLIVRKFQMYGVFCITNFLDFSDKENKFSLQITDFNHYTPLLLKVFWPGF